MEEQGQIGIIYKLLFPNGNCYVGQTTKTLEQRMKQHMRQLGDNSLVHRAIAECGIDQISWEVIDTATSIDELNEKETFWIVNLKSHVTNQHGYNLTLGGKGKIGYKPSKETRAKLSIANKGQVRSKETRAKMSAARMGMHPTDATIAKMSAARIGKHQSDETIEKISAAKMGHVVSDETRAKLSAAMSGENHPQFGKHRSNETRAKISESKRQRHAKTLLQIENT